MGRAIVESFMSWGANVYFVARNVDDIARPVYGGCTIDAPLVLSRSELRPLNGDNFRDRARSGKGNGDQVAFKTDNIQDSFC